MKSDALLEQVLDSPELPFAIDRLQAVLEGERPLRERFYEEITEDGKVEFINGKVVVQAPAKLKHIEVGGRLYLLLRTYVTRKKMGLVTYEKALVCLKRNDYEPDIAFFGLEKAQQFTAEHLKFPPPDWICEILSKSTEKTDRGTKFADYALHGVGEYWIVDPEREQIEIYSIDRDTYKVNAIVKAGTIRSEIISGFEIPVSAIFDDDQTDNALRALLVG